MRDSGKETCGAQWRREQVIPCGTHPLLPPPPPGAPCRAQRSKFKSKHTSLHHHPPIQLLILPLSSKPRLHATQGPYLAVTHDSSPAVHLHFQPFPPSLPSTPSPWLNHTAAFRPPLPPLGNPPNIGTFRQLIDLVEKECNPQMHPDLPQQWLQPLMAGLSGYPFELCKPAQSDALAQQEAYIEKDLLESNSFANDHTRQRSLVLLYIMYVRPVVQM